MELEVNDKIFKIYELDDTDTIKDRIASSVSSISKYSYFIPDFTLEKITDEYKQSKEKIKIQYIDILGVIKNDRFNDFDSLYSALSKVLPFTQLRLKEDIIFPWLVYNKQIQSVKNTENASLIFLDHENNFKKYDLPLPTLILNKFFQNRAEQIKKDLEEKIKTNKELTKERLTVYKAFQNSDKGIPYTKFELENTLLSIFLDMKYVSLMEIFNSIKLNKNIPFASFNNFFKISKDFLPFSDWTFSLKEVVTIYILERLNPKNIKRDHFSTTFLTIENDVPKLLIELSPSKSSISQDNFIDILFNSIGKPEITEVVEDNIKGVFYFSNHSFDKYIFSDLVMNDPVFSILLSINEGLVATKAKSELHIYLNSSKLGMVTANLIEYNNDEKPELGNTFVRVHILKAKNKKAVKLFQNILSRLFIIYDHKYNEIFDFYKKYIPEFGEKDEEEEERKNKILRLGDVSPEILAVPPEKKKQYQTYTRLCNNIPRVVSKEEAERIGKFIIYPKDDNFVKPNYFVCDQDKTFIYPGLKTNIYPSKEFVPYIPCCYAKDQRNDQFYRSYYYDEEIDTTLKGASQKKILTKKFADIARLGTLPGNITKFFETVDPTNVYARTGTSIGPDSFIECIMDAFSIGEFKTILKDPEIRKSEARKEREKMIEIVKDTGLCRQENFNKTNEEIVEYLESKEYFDPKMFISLLEYIYSCNIFLFTRDVDPNGEMSLPYYSQSYLKYKNDGPCVFIYEHSGSILNMVDYPHCELIIKEGKNYVYSFDYEDTISVKVRKMYEKVKSSYNLTTPIPDIIFGYNHEEGIPPIYAQKIDMYGKCRVLYLNVNGKKMSFVTNPIPPLPVKEVQYVKLFENDLDVVISFFKEYNIQLTKHVIKKKMLRQLVGVYGNVQVMIPVKKIIYKEIGKEFLEFFSNSKKSKEEILIENKISVMDIYNTNKKYARYIVEYIFWLFSNYINNRKIIKITEEDISDFILKYIKIDPNFIYGPIKKRFDTKAGLFYKNKIVVHTETAVLRIAYALKLGIIRHQKKIFEYYKHDTIENYYSDITDFDHFPNQVILYGVDSVNKWISEKKIVHKIFEHPTGDIIDEPYFFRNDLVDGKNIYLAQNIDTIGKAIYIAVKWNKSGFNIGLESKSLKKLKDLKYVKYFFKIEENFFDIEKIDVDGKDNSYDIKILEYKIKIKKEEEKNNQKKKKKKTEISFEEISRFTVLLKVEE
jgi:hypothetical protein